MPRLPLSVAAPLAAASAAYINGKFGVASDVWSAASLIGFGILCSRLEKQGRLNMFYRLEDFAKDPKIAKRTFLTVPQEEGQVGRFEWTYAEVYDIVLKYARWLKEEHGVQKGEIVAMDFKNKPQFIFVWWALWSLGAQPAFINCNLRDKALIHCVKISMSRLLLLDAELEDAMTDQVRAEFSPDDKGRAVETLILESALEEHILSLQPYRAPDEARAGITAKGPCILIYTSGTTGLPKAANVAWAKPQSGAVFWTRLLQLKQTDRYFTTMPLYHSSASVLCICAAFGTGCTIVLSPKFSPKTYFKQITQTKATVMQYIGEMCRYLVSSPATPWDRAHSLRLAFGNGMRPDVWQKFKDRFNIPDVCEFYGATESPTVTYVYSRNNFYRGSIGRGGLLLRMMFGGMSILVKHDHETDEPWRDPKTGFCTKVPTGEAGELLVWLDAANIQDKFQGYFGNEKASKGKILRDVLKKGDAYFRSGDLQKRDADGMWWFVDRVGDTFRWKGENVSTAEVSENLGTHPSLKEANVYGVQLPNHDGRAGCAAIGLVDGSMMNDALATELASHVRERLPRYAVPLFLRVMKEIEVTGTMKHQKVELRNQGVDPTKIGQDELYWLSPGAEKYSKFDKADWDSIVGGSAKL